MLVSPRDPSPLGSCSTSRDAPSSNGAESVRALASTQLLVSSALGGGREAGREQDAARAAVSFEARAAALQWLGVVFGFCPAKKVWLSVRVSAFAEKELARGRAVVTWKRLTRGAAGWPVLCWSCESALHLHVYSLSYIAITSGGSSLSLEHPLSRSIVKQRQLLSDHAI